MVGCEGNQKILKYAFAENPLAFPFELWQRQVWVTEHSIYFRQNLFPFNKRGNQLTHEFLYFDVKFG